MWKMQIFLKVLTKHNEALYNKSNEKNAAPLGAAVMPWRTAQ